MPKRPKTDHAARRARVDPRLKTPKENGRPPHAPTSASRGMVRMLLLLHRTQAEIAAAAGIDEKTLRKHYRHEIDTAAAQADAALMQTALMLALGGAGDQANWKNADSGMLRFLLDRRAGLKPAPQQHVMGHYDLAKISDDELNRIYQTLATAAVVGDAEDGDREEGD